MPASLAAQHRSFGVDLSVQAIAVHTRVDPVPGGTSLDEIRVVQPVVLARAYAMGGKLALLGSLNLEGWTMPEGELTRLYVKYLEDVIHEHPEVWLWSHRRWKREWKEEYSQLWIDNKPVNTTTA